MEKPTPAATEAFAQAFPDDPRAQKKKMFGMDAAFVNGNMFAGVFERGVTLRLGKARVDALLGEDGFYPFTPGGRTWPEYAIADAETWTGSDALAGWVREALEHTATLPAKVDKPKGTKAK
jgi:TfoX/Sxy family transcriptional regulator of competence genes